MAPTLLWLLLLTAAGFVYSDQPTTEKYDPVIEATTDVLSEATTIVDEKRNKTLSELVKEQTEAIKKILSEHKKGEPVLALSTTTEKIDAEEALRKKQESERQSIEELKLKCLNIFKELPVSTTQRTTQTAQPFGPPMKPLFLQPNRKPTKQPMDYFFFAPNPSAIYGYRNDKEPMDVAASEVNEDKAQMTERPATAVTPDQATTEKTVDGAIKYKYVKLEPLSLQKTVLTNGKTSFFWYKHVPNTQSFVQIPDVPENANVDVIAHPQNDPKTVPIPEQYQYYIDPHTGIITRNAKPQQPPQFYINPQNGLIYQQATPQQMIFHRREPAVTTQKPETTTTPKPIMPSYTVAYPPNVQTTTKKYHNELRFVMPMLLQEPGAYAKYPFEFDPYAYFPKNQQPPLMNLAVPYVPNYQMISTLSLPNIEKE